MSTFIVKTKDDRNVILKADRFSFDTNDNYNFYKANVSDPVASFPGSGVFAVLNQESEEVDFYSHDDWSPVPELDQVKDLLERAMTIISDHEVCCGGDHDFFRDYFEYTGEHVILTEEGWEPGSVKKSYLDSDPEAIIEEINAPKEVASE